MTQMCRNYANQDASDRYTKDFDPTRRVRDAARVDSVIRVVEAVINPFIYDGTELVNIYSGIIASPLCQEDFTKANKLGKESQRRFTSQFLSNPKELHQPLKKLNLQTFKSSASKPKKDKKGKNLSNRKMFARLIILVKQDRLKLKEVLTYSLGPVSYPLASSDGSLAKTPKSVIISLAQSKWPLEEESMDLTSRCALIIDAMCLVHSFLPSQLPRTFKDFAACISTKISQMSVRLNSSRVDVVFDTYPIISIKALEHARRNSQNSPSFLRRIISSEQQMPKQWREFLRHGPNKEDLTTYYLYRELMKSDIPFDLFVTRGASCDVRYRNGKIARVLELHCDHVEADMRVFLQSKHAAENYFKIILSSADSDVFVIGLCVAEKLPTTIYLEFGKFKAK